MNRINTLPRIMMIAMGIGVVALVYMYMAPESLPGLNSLSRGGSSHTMEVQGGPLPPDLFDLEVYHSDDFTNERGVRPPFWSNETRRRDHSWGPCYAPISAHRIHWKTERDSINPNSPVYPPYQPASKDPNDLAGLCRPSFLIIGAGKCGTR